MRQFSWLMAGLMLAAACQPTTPIETAPMRLLTNADLAPVMGKRLELSAAEYVVINADGTLSGDFSGAETRGTWVMRDGYFCRELSAGPTGVQPEDCQLMVRTADGVRVTRDRGKGSSWDYVIAS